MEQHCQIQNWVRLKKSVKEADTLQGTFRQNFMRNRDISFVQKNSKRKDIFLTLYVL